ncbi:bacteriocin immunity protein [Streptococcus halichoeri]|uniref:bacteriocin immunity protein n=1 Tax=Streptococcus halichoeri TaxID=254785 RepID=UPI0013584AAC|nr:bacteriocin immunity protein [Streptococcus halichoeri]
MKSNERTEWLKHIELLINSDSIKDNPELKNIFLTTYKALENNERDALARLTNHISWYLITHNYEAPKPIIDFAQQIAKEPHKERGKLAFLQMLALSLTQIK